MVRMRASVVLLVAAAACGPSGSDVPFLRDDHCPVGGCVEAGPSYDAGPITITPEPLENWDTTNAGALSGIFAIEATIDARVGFKVQLRQLLRLRIVQVGRHIHQKSTLCAFKLPDLEGVATLVIPPKLQSLISSDAKSTETEGDFLSTDAVVGAAYTPPPFLVLVGANLQNPATDPLPTKMDLTSAVDEDNDAHPGVTLLGNVATCATLQELYVALRTSGSIAGTVVTPDVITGKLTVKVDQKVLGYSDDCLADAEKLNIVVTPGSPFRAQRVGDAQDLDHNGNVSCPEIQLTAADMFPDWAQ